jgi:hypothetical protein
MHPMLWPPAKPNIHWRLLPGWCKGAASSLCPPWHKQPAAYPILVTLNHMQLMPITLRSRVPFQLLAPLYSAGRPPLR